MIISKPVPPNTPTIENTYGKEIKPDPILTFRILINVANSLEPPSQTILDGISISNDVFIITSVIIVNQIFEL